MRRLPLLIVAGTVAAAGAVAVAKIMSLPKPDDKAPPAVVAGGSPAGSPTAGDDAPSGTTGGQGTGYWTPDRMRSATPLPTPLITKEEYERLVGSRKKKPQ